MRNLRPLRNTLRLVAILALIAATVAVAQAQTTVTAIWDANTDPYTAGYRVYYGTASGSYLWSLDAGNQTSVPIPLAAGGTYYFTVRAYNSAYEYGPASSEASVSLATLATITGPTPGSTLAGSSVSFTWTTGFGALQYWLYVGTTGVGSANLWNQDLATATSRTVTGIPTTGAAVYVRLWTRTSTGWQFTDYTYTAAAVAACAPAAIEHPNPGAFLYGSTVPFTWNAGSGNTQYALSVGTTGAGATDIWDENQGAGLSRTVTGVPIDVPVYVRLSSYCSATWTFRDEVYNPLTVRARLLSPAPSSDLPGASATFTWHAGTGTSQYWLYVGSAPGAYDVWNQNQGVSLARAVSGLPMDGRRIYVRLWSLVGANWFYTDYGFTASGTSMARLVNPSEYSILPGATTTFTWSAGTSSTRYRLYVGTTGVGSSDIWNRDERTRLTRSVTGLPTDHRTVYVRLGSLIGGSWVYNDYQFRAHDGGTARGRLTFPDNGSTLVGSSTTFRWYPGAAATQYWLYVGTSPGGFNLYNASLATNLAATVTGLPTNGSTVYVRLWTLSGGTWTWNDYDFKAAP